MKMKATNNELEVLALELSYQLKDRGLHSLISFHQFLAKTKYGPARRAQIAAVALGKGLVTLTREQSL